MSRKLKPKPKLSVAKRQPPKWQRERNFILIVWTIIPLTIALALGLVGFWGYDNYVGVWHKPVAKINETTVNMDYYVKMLRLYSVGSSQTTIDPTTLPKQVLTQIEDDELLKQGTPALGLEATPEEITQKINSYLLNASGSGGNTTGGNETAGNSTRSQEELDRQYQQWLERVKLTDAEYRGVVEATVLRDKLTQYIKEQKVPKEAKQAHVHAILLDTQEQAELVLNKLKNNVLFSQLATEYSVDAQSKDYGGDLGWMPQGILLPELDKAAFSLEPGNFSDIIQETKGYYIIMVSEIEENRPVSDTLQQLIADNEFVKWFKEQRDASQVEEYLTSEKVSWAMNRIK